MATKQNDWAKKQRALLLSKWGHTCFRCGSKVRLEFAHKRPTELHGQGRGRKERVSDVRRNPDAYVLLCHDCHAWFDRS